MAKLRHLKLSPVTVACSPWEAIKPYGGKRVTDDSELVTCEKCQEYAAKLVEQQLSPEVGGWARAHETDPSPKPPKFDLSLGARARVKVK